MSNASPWKAGVIGAVACAAAGALLLVDWTLLQLATFLAMLFIARGALHLVTTSFEGLAGASSALLGLSEVTVGLVLLIWPSPSLLVVVVVVGVWTVARAVTVVTTDLATRHDHPPRGLALVPPLLELVLGASLFARSSGSVREVAVIVGVLMGLEGLMELGGAVAARRNRATAAAVLAHP